MDRQLQKRRWLKANERLAVVTGTTIAALFGVGWAAAQAGAGAARTSAAPCRFEVAQKLGLPFYRVCGAQPGAASFWISAPVPCSPGERGNVSCPMATALVHDVGVTKVGAREVAMLDSFTAHRLCGMRFAGRMPTRSERAAASERAGVSTVIATQASETSDALLLTELPEWISEGACDNPSLPGADCQLATYPTAPLALPLAWEALRACEATPTSPRDEGTLDCRLGSACEGQSQPAANGAKRIVTGALSFPLLGKPYDRYALRCEKPATTPRPAQRHEPLAAVRCVIDDRGLGRAAASALGR